MKRITTIALHSVFLVALVFSTGYTLAQKETQEKQQTEKKQVLTQSVPSPLPSDVQKETQEKQQTEKKQVPTPLPRPLPSDVQKETQEKQQTEKKQVPRPVPDMTRRVQEANKAFRDAVASEMQEAARQAGVKIRTDNFIAIPFDDSGTVIVNSMIEGVDRLSIEQLAKGADVLFIYSGAELGTESRIPAFFIGRSNGFALARISKNAASGKWLVQFKNLEGRVVLETEAIVEKPDSSAAKMQPMCTLGPKGELILFDEHDPFKNITIPLVSGKGYPSGVRPRFVSQSRTLREAAWQVVKEVAKEPVSIEQVVPVSLGPVPLPDAITVLFNCGTENKPDWCECTLVERGSDYGIWSCIGQVSKKWYVFLVTK
jgi:hypothetical protein